MEMELVIFGQVIVFLAISLGTMMAATAPRRSVSSITQSTRTRSMGRCWWSFSVASDTPLTAYPGVQGPGSGTIIERTIGHRQCPSHRFVRNFGLGQGWEQWPPSTSSSSTSRPCPTAITTRATGLYSRWRRRIPAEPISRSRICHETKTVDA